MQSTENEETKHDGRHEKKREEEKQIARIKA